MNPTSQELKTELIENFSFLEDLDQKYEYIIELGKKLPALDSNFKKDEFRIKGCQSTVWLIPEVNENTISFKADSDSVFVKGLISLLIYVSNHQLKAEVAKLNTDFIHQIGLGNYLSPTRSNGLVSMVKQMKLYAQ